MDVLIRHDRPGLGHGHRKIVLRLAFRVAAQHVRAEGLAGGAGDGDKARALAVPVKTDVADREPGIPGGDGHIGQGDVMRDELRPGGAARLEIQRFCRPDERRVVGHQPPGVVHRDAVSGYPDPDRLGDIPGDVEGAAAADIPVRKVDVEVAVLPAAVSPAHLHAKVDVRAVGDLGAEIPLDVAPGGRPGDGALHVLQHVDIRRGAVLHKP